MSAHDDERAVFVDRYDGAAIRQMATEPETPPPNLDKADVDSLVRTLDILAAAYSTPTPITVDPESYAAGHRNGARAAYLDCAARLRETAGAE